MAQAFDLRKLELSGEPFPVAEQIGFNVSSSFTNASVSTNGTLTFLSGGIRSRQLIWFDRSGKQIELVGAPGEINDIVLSRDGKRLAMQRLVDGNSDIWLTDLARGVSSRFTFDASIEDNPVWSPDGKLIAFSSGAAGADVTADLYRKVSTGVGNSESLFASDLPKEATDWSSDGRFILFNVYDPNNGSDIWVLPLFGDGKPYPLLNTRFEESAGFFSPDGHWFAYASNETGRYEVYVQTFPQTGGRWLISTGGGGQPHWRADGKELFYVGPDKSLMSVEVKTGSTFETSTPKPLFLTKVRESMAPNRYVVAPDGQRFLINCPAGELAAAPIIVIVNWTIGLKK
jgi:Tol biopolymer transport system component